METQNQEDNGSLVEFLKTDFSDSYSQMRHYDKQVLELFKFTFTAYTAVTTLAVGLYKVGHEHNIDLATPLLFGLAVAFLIGLFGFSLILRNRVYYVRVARYVNEIRREVLSHHPLGIRNVAGMYIDPSLPKHLDLISTQTAHWLVVAALNSLLLGIFLFIGRFPSGPCMTGVILISWGFFWLKLELRRGIFTGLTTKITLQRMRKKRE
jgi:hypothetical protein